MWLPKAWNRESSFLEIQYNLLESWKTIKTKYSGFVKSGKEVYM